MEVVGFIFLSEATLVFWNKNKRNSISCESHNDLTGKNTTQLRLHSPDQQMRNRNRQKMTEVDILKNMRLSL